MTWHGIGVGGAALTAEWLCVAGLPVPGGGSCVCDLHREGGSLAVAAALALICAATRRLVGGQT
jgi:hypothetical protein